MLLHNILPFAHMLLKNCVGEGGLAVDATAGKGNDTLLLAQCVGSGGRVWAFDIQAAALSATDKRLQQAGVRDRVTLVQASHADMADYVPEGISAAVFNFGYLPDGDKNITTCAESSVRAVACALNLLKTGGLLVAVLYRGHPQGCDEAAAVLDFACGLPQQGFQVLRYEFANRKNHPPFLLAIEKTAHDTIRLPESLTDKR